MISREAHGRKVTIRAIAAIRKNSMPEKLINPNRSLTKTKVAESKG